MMLRASVELNGGDVDLQAITDNSAAADCGIDKAPELLRFADAAVGSNDVELDLARAQLLEVGGPEVLVDAAAIVANFQRMVRIADGTGIPLDAPVAALTVDVREDLGLNEFATAQNTPEIEGLQKLIARPLGQAVRGGMRAFGWLRNRRSS
jgi:hypothetical protein